MGYNSVVSSHLKSIGIPQIYGLSRGPSDLGCHNKGIIYYNIYPKESCSICIVLKLFV